MTTLIVQTALGVIGVILVWMVSILVSTFKEMKTDVKAMSTSVIEMNLKLEIVMTKHDNTEELAKQNTVDILGLRDRLHTLEGRESQMMHFIDEYAKKQFIK